MLKTEATPPHHLPPLRSFKARVDCSGGYAPPFILQIGLFVPQTFFRGTVALEAAALFALTKRFRYGRGSHLQENKVIKAEKLHVHRTRINLPLRCRAEKNIILLSSVLLY